MDLSKLDLVAHANVGAVMEVMHPITNDVLTYKGQPVTITLLGAESTPMREAMSQRAKRQLSQKKSNISSLDEAEALSAELLSSVVTDWYGFEENGVELECSKEEATRIFTKYSWLRSQADAFVSDRVNFFKA